MSRENVETIRRSYEAMTRGDFDAWLEPVHAQAELHELAELPDTAVYRGHQELRRWAEGAMQLVEKWQWTPEEFVYEGESVVVVRTRLRAQGRGSGVPIEQVLFHVFEFRDNEVIRFRGFLGRDEALEAVGLRGRSA
jgi:ketosteroid isomerase-like protein